MTVCIRCFLVWMTFTKLARSVSGKESQISVISIPRAARTLLAAQGSSSLRTETNHLWGSRISLNWFDKTLLSATSPLISVVLFSSISKKRQQSRVSMASSMRLMRASGVTARQTPQTGVTTQSQTWVRISIFWTFLEWVQWDKIIGIGLWYFD